MDTVYYEGREHRFVDYSITDIMQMLGIACRYIYVYIYICIYIYMYIYI
jgi:replicative superfamily II helicase